LNYTATSVLPTTLARAPLGHLVSQLYSDASNVVGDRIVGARLVLPGERLVDHLAPGGDDGGGVARIAAASAVDRPRVITVAGGSAPANGAVDVMVSIHHRCIPLLGPGRFASRRGRPTIFWPGGDLLVAARPGPTLPRFHLDAGCCAEARNV